MNQPFHTYRQFSVQGSTPLGLVVMLYDGAIASLQRMIAAIEVHDIEQKCKHLNKALAIIAQLEGTLNFESGGEAAQTLKTLYMYSRAQAMKANIENSSEILRSLVENLMTVRQAWYEADHRPSPTFPTPASVESPQSPSSPTESRPLRLAA